MASEVERLRVAKLEVEQLRASLLATHGGVEPSGLLDELLTAVRAEHGERIAQAIEKQQAMCQRKADDYVGELGAAWDHRAKAHGFDVKLIRDGLYRDAAGKAGDG